MGMDPNCCESFSLSKRFVEETFAGSLPKFLAAFTGSKKLSAQEVDALQRLINEHRDVEQSWKGFFTNLEDEHYLLLCYFICDFARLLLKGTPKIFSYLLLFFILHV